MKARHRHAAEAHPVMLLDQRGSAKEKSGVYAGKPDVPAGGSAGRGGGIAGRCPKKALPCRESADRASRIRPALSRTLQPQSRIHQPVISPNTYTGQSVVVVLEPLLLL